MSIIISVSNQKGGVSKTVSSYNLASCLALNHNRKVLLADIDPQANLSEYLGYVPDGKPTMTHLIMDVCMNGAVNPETVKSAVRYCEENDVDYIPADINLAGSETMMASALSRETVLRRILSKEVTDEYDFVIIDCLPSLGTLLVNAISASDRILIPVQTQKFSMDGLSALLNIYRQIKSSINPDVDILGILPTMTEKTTVCKKAMTSLEEEYSELLFKTSISKSVEAQKSCENRIPLCSTECKLGMEYAALTTEVLERCRKQNLI